jgi:hypothetical protein
MRRALILQKLRKKFPLIGRGICFGANRYLMFVSITALIMVLKSL